MTETPAAPPQGAVPSPDRVQALLSRAVEEQLGEQRAVSTILAELRQQVHGLTEALRHTAADASVERLGGLVGNVVADLRTATSLLGQRIEALSKRIDQVAADAAAPSQAAATQIGAMSEALSHMSAAMQQLGSFPAALAALQKDVAGMHDRLQPLAELRASVAELGVGGGDASGGPRLEAIEAKLDELVQGTRPDRVRDSVVDALAGRLAKLEEAAARPVVGPEVLRSALGDFRATLDSSTGERNEELAAAISAVENRLGQVGQRIADIGDAAGAVPGLANDIARLSARLNELSGLSESMTTVAEGMAQLREGQPEGGTSAAIAALRDDIAALKVQVAAGPPPEDLANAISRQVADRLVESLAPRIADVVLTRVSAAMVTQLGEALSPKLQADTEALVRNSVNESERRVLAHLDEAVLALAEALLRKGKPRPPGAPRLVRTSAEAAEEVDSGPSGKHARADDAEAGWEQADYDVQGIVDRLNAAPSTPEPEQVTPRPPVTIPDPPPMTGAVTTSLAPSPSSVSVVAPAAEKPTPAKKAGAKAPAKKAAVKQAPVKKAAAKAPAKKAARPVPAAAAVAKVAQSRSAAARAVKPAVRGAARPQPGVTPGRTVLERTPDLPVDDIEPVRGARPTQPRPLGRPSAAAQRAAAAYRPDAPKPLQRPTPPAPSQGGRDDSKRKWWKPGG